MIPLDPIGPMTRKIEYRVVIRFWHGRSATYSVWAASAAQAAEQMPSWFPGDPVEVVSVVEAPPSTEAHPLDKTLHPPGEEWVVSMDTL